MLYLLCETELPDQGLSAFADHPKDGALSLKPLLDVAETGIPEALHPETSVFVGATAGLRLLPGLLFFFLL